METVKATVTVSWATLVKIVLILYLDVIKDPWSVLESNATICLPDNNYIGWNRCWNSLNAVYCIRSTSHGIFWLTMHVEMCAMKPVVLYDEFLWLLVWLPIYHMKWRKLPAISHLRAGPLKPWNQMPYSCRQYT